jgi:hypothetical protein
LLLLERSYTLLRGIAMRIHRIPLASIKPDTMIDGKPLIVVDRDLPDRQHGRPRGAYQCRLRNHLTLVSDDNFSPIQRNLLLQFALVRE